MGLYKILNMIRLGNHVENHNGKKFDKEKLKKELDSFITYDYKIKDVMTLNTPEKRYYYAINE